MASRYIYLLDTCAFVNYFRKQPDYPDIEDKLNHIIEQKGLGKATIFMPNFCIAEVFNTFARLRYRDNRIHNDTEYETVKNAFRHHIRRGALIAEYPLHIYHIYNTDYIIPFEHQWDTGIDQDRRMSTFDILIIGMGMELVRHFGDENVRIITCDGRIEMICSKLRKFVTDTIRERYGIPKNTIYPMAINLNIAKVEQLPAVEGQLF